MNLIPLILVLITTQLGQIAPADPLINEPLPMAYVEAVQTVVILPGIRNSDIRANGQLLPGQRAQVWAVVGDGYDGEIWIWLSAPGGQTGWILCEGRALVRSTDSGKVLGKC